MTVFQVLPGGCEHSNVRTSLHVVDNKTVVQTVEVDEALVLIDGGFFDEALAFLQTANDDDAKNVLDSLSAELVLEILECNENFIKQLLAACEVRTTEACDLLREGRTVHVWPDGAAGLPVHMLGRHSSVQTLCGRTLSVESLEHAPRGSFNDTSDLIQCQACSMYCDEYDCAYETRDYLPWPDSIGFQIWSTLSYAIGDAIIRHQPTSSYEVRSLADSLWYPIILKFVARLIVENEFAVCSRLIGSHNVEADFSWLPTGSARVQAWLLLVEKCFPRRQPVSVGRSLLANMISSSLDLEDVV